MDRIGACEVSDDRSIRSGSTNKFWWGGRAVECTRLESVHGRKVIASSNLAPTARAPVV